MSDSPRQRSLARVYRQPALLFFISLAGLIGALVGDGPVNYLSCLALASVPAVIVRAFLGRAKPD